MEGEYEHGALRARTASSCGSSNKRASRTRFAGFAVARSILACFALFSSLANCIFTRSTTRSDLRACARVKSQERRLRKGEGLTVVGEAAMLG